jgi:Ca2+-binding EF-hand superfamily protein
MRAALMTVVLALAPALAWAQQPCTPNADSVVDSIYRQLLQRPAGGEGNARAEQLRNGQISVREIVRDIAKSQEHADRFLPANDRAQAVTALYRHLLGRDPDPAGLNNHVEGRIALVALVDTFVNSPEYQQKYGDNGVPGTSLRYCRDAGPSSSSANVPNRLRNMDRNGNGTIERAEWNGNQVAFEERDWNHDGVLSGDELEPGARRGGRRAAERDFDPAAPEAWNDQAFRELDRNGDNRITSSEWFHNADYFRRADRNRDGSLTMNEFTTGAAASSPVDFASLDIDRSGTLTPNEWRWERRIFQRYDTDDDGLLTRREFNDGGGAPANAR